VWIYGKNVCGWKKLRGKVGNEIWGNKSGGNGKWWEKVKGKEKNKDYNGRKREMIKNMERNNWKNKIIKCWWKRIKKNEFVIRKKSYCGN
jgi:hypothetical protein